MPKANAPAGGPLAGVKVIEACSILSGPITCRILADYGADVVKIEHPSGGDVLRTTGLQRDGRGLTNEIVNRNKRSVSMYLGDPDVASVMRKIVRSADVVVENFRPGTFERWGLGYETLSEENPGLILAHISGFGQSGYYADHAAFGTIAECMSGFAHLVGPVGGEPTLGSFGLADNIAASAAAVGILVALWDREHNGGRGTEVDASLLGPMLGVMGGAIAWADQLDIEVDRAGNKSRNSAPRNTYRCADGRWIGLAAQTTNLARIAVTWAGRADLVGEPWFDKPSGRAEHSEVDEAVAAKVGSLPREQVLRECLDLKIPVGPVYSPRDVAKDPRLNGDGLLVEYDHPELGRFRMPGQMAPLASRTNPVVQRPAPDIGEHTEEVLMEFGVTADELDHLRAKGVVR